MEVRVITMRYEEWQKGFSEEQLKEVTYGRDVLDVHQEFFMHGGQPHLVLTLKMADGGARSKGGAGGGTDASKVKEDELEKEMPAATHTAYLALKDWRNKKARSTGYRAFTIARNMMLVEIVMKAPKTLAALHEIYGAGDTFCKNYGKEVLEIIKDLEPVKPAEAAKIEEAAKKVAKTAKPAAAADADSTAEAADGGEPQQDILVLQ